MNGMIHPSVAEIPEASLVEQLLAQPCGRNPLLRIHGLPDDPIVFQKVPLQDAPSGRDGDVDILLWPRSDPGRAAAIEVKRLKIGAGAFRSGRPNKLREYAKAVNQANRLVQVGFAQVYLYVLVVVDSRESNYGRITYDGLTPELRGMIAGTVSVSGLNPRIGLVRHEFVQPMDYAPLTVDVYNGHSVRPAERVEQPVELTKWITRLIESRAPGATIL